MKKVLLSIWLVTLLIAILVALLDKNFVYAIYLQTLHHTKLFTTWYMVLFLIDVLVCLICFLSWIFLILKQHKHGKTKNKNIFDKI